MMVPRNSLDDYLPTKRLFFGSRSIESMGCFAISVKNLLV